jgi:hypothetical protein
MRKAFLVTALALLVAFAAYATESDPSNTVGFIKMQRNGHGFLVGFSPFMLSFDYYQPGYTPTTAIDTIIGAQGSDADELWSQTRGLTAIYFGGLWYNVYPLYNTDAYWWYHYLYPADTVNVTTAGEVVTSDILYGSIATGFNAYGIPIADTMSCSRLDLDDISPDPGYLEVWDQIQGTIYIYFSPSWYPNGVILPTYPIWVYNTGAPTGAWTFSPGDDGRDGSTSAARISPITPETRSVDRATAPSNTRNAPSPNRRSR